jgi:hypothetical protein
MNTEKLLLGFTVITMVVLSISFLRPPFTIEKVVIAVVSLGLALRLVYNIWRAGKDKQDNDQDNGDQ